MDDKELTAQLDDEEREILESFERDEWVPVADKEAVIARLQSAAAATLRKERRVNIRMTTADLAALPVSYTHLDVYKRQVPRR